MASQTTTITSLTADYDAIERAIRETSRGRWFLTCYLERNRSAETKMLLGAISKLEGAMRDNGHVMRDHVNYSILPALRDTIDEARQDLARLPNVDNESYEKPLESFDFESIPASGAEELRIIRDASTSIHNAAYALHSAGVFQGVAQQIAESAEAIENSCMVQEAVLLRASRMAALICELEAELISACEDHTKQFSGVEHEDNWPTLPRKAESDADIPDEVVEQLSIALAECYDSDGFKNGVKDS